jgi:histidyl-tRNA synthetase
MELIVHQGKDFDGLLKERLAISAKLVRAQLSQSDFGQQLTVYQWSAGIRTEYQAKVKPKLPQQFKAADAAGIPLAIILGQDEMSSGKVRVKELGLPEGHAEKDGVLIDMTDVVAEVQKRLK